MFSNVLRQQARLSLRAVARSAAPASRTLSSLVLRQAVVAPAVSRLTAARAFSSASVLAFERRDQAPTPASESIYIGNMPWDMTKEDLTELFSEFGQVESVRIQTHADGRPRGFAHITFSNVEAATAAVTSSAAEPLHVAGRDLFVDYARQASLGPRQEPNSKVYFARFHQDENALRQLMTEFKDQIVSIYFIRDGNTGEKTNAGFVEFEDVATATEAIDKLNGTATEQGNIVLSYARPRRDAPRGGDKRRGGGGRQDNRSSYSNRGYQSRDRDY
ncbi:hypothetical protein CVT25_008281 [Psilocybe cyanescens]|uniref:RRM domain-containing protein n=1 Tax=Psilocybe cyanescens TaxID=93625 RepID=A0A409XJP2_PSICY|nr:hypothetical protein CVT25_008281 [Psilocybe cyanescens]